MLCADDSNASDILKPSPPWYPALGSGYLDDAFRAAHDAAPRAKLFYNDYGAEGLRYSVKGKPKSGRVRLVLSRAC